TMQGFPGTAHPSFLPARRGWRRSCHLLSISKYPAGQYRITPEQLQSLRPVNYRAGTVHEGYGPTLTPAPQPILFEIR
ncbi:hypothetical protein, partial [Deinococcus wulumuqiensis]